MKNIRDCYNELINTGGATFKAENIQYTGCLSEQLFKSPPNGYMVSMPAYERIFEVEFFTFTMFQMCVLSVWNAQMIRDSYFGFWTFEGNVYFGVSLNVADRRTAERIGNEYKQKAIFDINTCSEIIL